MAFISPYSGSCQSNGIYIMQQFLKLICWKNQQKMDFNMGKIVMPRPLSRSISKNLE